MIEETALFIIGYLAYNMLWLMIATVQIFLFKKDRIETFSEDIETNIFIKILVLICIIALFPAVICYWLILEGVKKYQNETGKRI